MADPVLLANLKGGPGPAGPNTVPTDEAIANAANTPGSATQTALDGKYVPKWEPLKTYLAGYAVLNPTGDVVTAKANFTAGLTFDASKWNLSPTYGTTASVAALATATIAADPTINALAATLGTKTITRTNLSQNPSFENGTTGWGGVNCTVSNPSGSSYVGSKNLRLTSTAAGAITVTGPTGATVPVTAGDPFAISVYIKGVVGRNAAIRASWTGATATTGSYTTIASTSTYQRITFTGTVPSGATALRADVLLNSGGAAIGDVIDIDALLLEKSATVGPYFDGDSTDTLTVDYTWTGTAGSSTSTMAVFVPPAAVVADSSVAAQVPQPLTKAALDAAYARTAVALTPEAILQRDFSRCKGGAIGTNGKAAVALRFDHWLNNFGNVVLPLLRARGIPSGVAVYSRMLTPGDGYVDVDSTDFTWTDVQNWNIQDGVEIWSHSRSHVDTPAAYDSHSPSNPLGFAGLVDEIVGSKAELEAFMPNVKVQGWMQPGNGARGGYPFPYFDFDSTKLSSFYTTDAGKLLRQTYAVAETDANGVGRRSLPSGPIHGMGHLSTDSQTLVNLKKAVDEVIDLKLGLEFQTHLNLDSAGFNTTADFTELLDYLVLKRDAGLLEIVTPSGLYVADPERTTRAALIAGGDFIAPFDPVTAPGRWAGTTSMTLGSDGGVPYLAIPSSQTVAIQNLEQTVRLGFDGETFGYEMEVRRTVSGTAATAQMKVRNSSTGVAWDQTYSLAIPSGTGWTKMRGVFTIPKGVIYFQAQAGRLSGGGVDMRKVKIYKV